MDESYAIRRYEQAAALLPLRWQQQARQLPPRQMARAEELRLRAGGPMTVLLPEGEITPGQGGQIPPLTQTDLEQLCDAVTDYSRYAAGETLSRGYLTARGGFRVGVCGTAVLREGVNTNLRDISSVTVRIGREQPGLGDEVLSQLFREGQFRSTVLLSPPGLGKTTLLRDLIRGLSDGVGGLPEHRVSVVDERGEIAVMYQGVPQMAVGRHTDVLDACPKAVGIPILLRAANPQVIAVDEITVREDIAAMAAAAHCGVRFLATIHADGRQELGRKPLFSQLLKAKVFEKAVTIRREGAQRQYIGPVVPGRDTGPAAGDGPGGGAGGGPGGDGGGDPQPAAAHAPAAGAAGPAVPVRRVLCPGAFGPGKGTAPSGRLGGRLPGADAAGGRRDPPGHRADRRRGAERLRPDGGGPMAGGAGGPPPPGQPSAGAAFVGGGPVRGGAVHHLTDIEDDTWMWI